MPDPTFLTEHLADWLARLRAGDSAAKDELFRACQGRLNELAHRMIRRHASVRRWTDTADVVQNAALRLLRALETTSVSDTRGFLNLAAAVIRCELIDLSRHFHGPQGVGANHASVAPREGEVGRDPSAPDDGAELDRWAALHEAVEKLPTEEREVFGLTFYHGWTQPEIAELFGVDERTVRRRWKAACLALHTVLGGALPDL